MADEHAFSQTLDRAKLSASPRARAARALWPQVGRDQFEQFPGVDDLGELPETGKVAFVAGHQVVRPGLLRTFQEDIVIRVGRDFESSRRGNEYAAAFEQVEDLAK